MLQASLLFSTYTYGLSLHESCLPSCPWHVGEKNIVHVGGLPVVLSREKLP